jgi:predicted nucleic acid-binding protein
MAAVVVDASAIMSFLLAEKLPADEAWLGFLVQGALAPAHFSAEVANSLLVAMRRGRISNAERAEAIGELTNHRIEIDEALDWLALDRVSGLAERHKLSVYAAIYLDLALRKGLPLATYDAPLAAAARGAGVTLVA